MYFTELLKKFCREEIRTKMQITTKMKYYYMCNRMVKIYNTTLNVGEEVEKKELSFIASGGSATKEDGLAVY